MFVIALLLLLRGGRDHVFLGGDDLKEDLCLCCMKNELRVPYGYLMVVILGPR